MRGDPYRFVARWYDRLFGPMNRALRLLGLRMFRPREGMTILDVGCGTGAHLEIYERYGCALYGIDPSPAMIEIARGRLGDRAGLCLGDASAMPYEDRSFDLVISMLALHEMDHSTRSSAISEMTRVLKDSGHVLLIDHHPSPVGSFRAWRKKLVILLFEAAAGRKHYRNYRHFVGMKGLPTLITEHALVIEKERIVSEAPLALFLLSTE